MITPRGNFETHTRGQSDLDPFYFAATDLLSVLDAPANPAAIEQSADHVRARTNWVREQLSINHRAQPRWTIRGAIE